MTSEQSRYDNHGESEEHQQKKKKKRMTVTATTATTTTTTTRKEEERGTANRKMSWRLQGQAETSLNTKATIPAMALTLIKNEASVGTEKEYWNDNCSHYKYKLMERDNEICLGDVVAAYVSNRQANDSQAKS
ncbi:hypothetical protein RFI_17809, partial [Reticulomyxa filosa]